MEVFFVICEILQKENTEDHFGLVTKLLTVTFALHIAK
jgi:hypothetical protein